LLVYLPCFGATKKAARRWVGTNLAAFLCSCVAYELINPQANPYSLVYLEIMSTSALRQEKNRKCPQISENILPVV
jgi:hypothetical protein